LPREGGLIGNRAVQEPLASAAAPRFARLPLIATVMRHIESRARLTAIGLLLLSGLTATAAGNFETADPLRAFVGEEYPLGSDYFIHGKGDTVLLRCVLAEPEYSFDGVALSEWSIWGNRGGDWEVFRKSSGAAFVYVGTWRLTNHACLESCPSKEFLSTGQCTWQRGWPRR
jgi:hypothetical protein